MHKTRGTRSHSAPTNKNKRNKLNTRPSRRLTTNNRTHKKTALALSSPTKTQLSSNVSKNIGNQSRNLFTHLETHEIPTSLFSDPVRYQTLKFIDDVSASDVQSGMFNDPVKYATFNFIDDCRGNDYDNFKAPQEVPKALFKDPESFTKYNHFFNAIRPIQNVHEEVYQPDESQKTMHAV